MFWTESVELVSCRVKRRSSEIQLISLFFHECRKNYTVNGDMPGAASLWLWNRSFNLITTAIVETPNHVASLPKVEYKTNKSSLSNTRITKELTRSGTRTSW